MAVSLSPEICRNSLLVFVYDNKLYLLIGMTIVSLLFTLLIVRQIVASSLERKDKFSWIFVTSLHLIGVLFFFTFGMYLVARCAI
jgi:hypothetical protein